jgi:tetratricopeptide (TPR) repeat protein
MDSYFNTSQFKQLLQNYENLRDKGICSYIDAEEFTDIADYYQMLGEPQKALEAIDMALKIFPGSALPLCFKARIILIAENNPKKAEELIEQVADKSNMEYAYTKAEIMLGDNKPQQADRYLKERMKTFGGDEEDFILDCASIFADYNEYDLAEQWLKRSTLTEDDDYKDIQARILMDRGMFDESERIINEFDEGFFVRRLLIAFLFIDTVFDKDLLQRGVEIFLFEFSFFYLEFPFEERFGIIGRETKKIADRGKDRFLILYHTAVRRYVYLAVRKSIEGVNRFIG